MSLAASEPGLARQASTKRPVKLAIICNSLPPYRIHFHRRIAHEMPEVELHTLCTHQMSDGRWGFNPPPELNAVDFSMGQSITQQGKPRYIKRDWHRAKVMIKWMKQHEINAVVCIGYNDVTRLGIISWCHRNGIACYLWGDSNIRGDFATGLKGMIKHAMVSRVIRKCTGVMPCGSLGAKYFRKYGAQADRTFYVPYEPDYELIANLPEEQIKATAARFKLSQNRRRFIFSARLVQVKRPDLLIDAFIQIADQRPEWDLVIAGDGPLRQSIEQRVPQALRPRVTFTGFIDDQAIVSALYRISDVLVLPSDYEPWALVVNEAAAAGLAVISSDVVGAAADLVRDGMNGFLFQSGSVTALKDRLLSVSDKNAIERFKGQSREVLAQWRAQADPVDGLRKALQSAGVLSDRRC